LKKILNHDPTHESWTFSYVHCRLGMSVCACVLTNLNFKIEFEHLNIKFSI